RHYPYILSTRPPPPTTRLFPYTPLSRSYPPRTAFTTTGHPKAAASIVGAQRGTGTPSAPSRSRIARLSCTYRSGPGPGATVYPRSEEHTSELQSRGHLVCRLLLGKKNTT